MRRVLIIGIGAGDPDLVTMQAARAIAAVDVFVALEKRAEVDDLAAVRREVISRFATNGRHRTLAVADPVRDPAAPYESAVAGWHLERVVALERAILDSTGAEETIGFLVWGDPSLYDSTVRLVDRLLARRAVTFVHEVIAGISSVQLLTARHRIALNRIGGAVQITTGRLLTRSGVPAGVDDVVVMLDGAAAFTTLVGAGFEIFWGAYLGGPHEILIRGALDDVADEILRVRAAARAAHGWVFDVYLLRRLPTA